MKPIKSLILVAALALAACPAPGLQQVPASSAISAAPKIPARVTHGASGKVFAAYQPNTVQASSATGYSLVYATPVNEASISCRGGEYWVRPFSTASTKVSASGSNGAVTSPVGAPIEAGWIRMLAGDTVEFGSEGSVPAGSTDPISQIDIYCVTGGAGNELLVNAH